MDVNAKRLGVGGELEGGRAPLDKDGLAGKFVLLKGDDDDDQKTGCEADDKRCVYCVCFFAGEWRRKWGLVCVGGQRNDFRKQKLKGFSFVRMAGWDRKFSDNI